MSEAKSNTDKRLASIVDRIERLENDRADLSGDIKDIRKEAKSVGYDPKILALVLRRRKAARAEVEEQDALLATYEAALGLM